MLTPCSIHCPYCGETIDLLLDGSIAHQQYIEDCPVCCRPITLDVAFDEDGEPHVRAAGEDEA